MKNFFSIVLLTYFMTIGINASVAHTSGKTKPTPNKGIHATVKKDPVDLSKYNFLWNRLKKTRTNEEKHFVVIIPSYNNSTRYKRNLDSIFMQKYDNYHVIYIDDASPDGTGDFVEKYIKEKQQEHRVLLIKNKERLKAMANIYTAVNLCNNSDIIASCDGDDYWANDHVLALLNKIYKDPNIWMTHGSLMYWPQNLIRPQKAYPKEIIEKNKFREFGWQACGLRSYYAWLFKKIKIEDLMHEGNFVEANSDYVMVNPMLEMAGFRHKYISDVLYIADNSTGLNDSKKNRKIQKKIGKELRNKGKYLPLSEKPIGV